MTTETTHTFKVQLNDAQYAAAVMQAEDLGESLEQFLASSSIHLSRARHFNIKTLNCLAQSTTRGMSLSAFIYENFAFNMPAALNRVVELESTITDEQVTQMVNDALAHYH